MESNHDGRWFVDYTVQGHRKSHTDLRNSYRSGSRSRSHPAKTIIPLRKQEHNHLQFRIKRGIRFDSH